MPQMHRKSLEQIVEDVGRYPMEAFIFVQECIGLAADHVHGPVSEDEAAVARWMAAQELDYAALVLAHEDNTLPADILRLLDRLGGAEKMNRHVTGAQLCWALRDAALKHWGLMAKTVLARWNITRTEDIGAIIFALVDNGWLQKQPTDHLDDFDHVFDFEQALEQAYRIG